jgi:hypothetical protein
MVQPISLLDFPCLALNMPVAPDWGTNSRFSRFGPSPWILAWVLIVAAFYQKPELLTGAQRLMQRGIETVGDTVPSPWGPRMEFVVREIGGVIWLQITLVILALRLALSTIAAVWRSIAGRDRRQWNQ